MIIKQDNREFIEIKNNDGSITYIVHSIDGRWPVGRESSYGWKKCLKCGKIVGTQFNGFGKHTKACRNTNL